MGLVRVLCATTALAGAAPCSRVCAALAAGLGGRRRCRFPRLSRAPLPFPRAPRVVRGGSFHPGVPYPRPPVRHCMRSVRSAGSVRLPLRFAPRALCVCVRSRSRGVRALPPFPGRCGVRTSRGSGAGRRVGRSMRFVPLHVSCPSPMRRVASSGGATQSLSPRAWLWIVCPLVGGLVRPGRSGAGGVGGVGGGAVCVPSGAWLGGPGGRGTGGRCASVCPSASLGRAPKRASSASLSPWRVWSPYCSGSCPCAAARMRFAGCPCAPAPDCRHVEVAVEVGG